MKLWLKSIEGLFPPQQHHMYLKAAFGTSRSIFSAPIKESQKSYTARKSFIGALKMERLAGFFVFFLLFLFSF